MTPGIRRIKKVNVLNVLVYERATVDEENGDNIKMKWNEKEHTKNNKKKEYFCRSGLWYRIRNELHARRIIQKKLTKTEREWIFALLPNIFIFRMKSLFLALQTLVDRRWMDGWKDRLYSVSNSQTIHRRQQTRFAYSNNVEAYLNAAHLPSPTPLQTILPSIAGNNTIKRLENKMRSNVFYIVCLLCHKNINAVLLSGLSWPGLAKCHTNNTFIFLFIPSRRFRPKFSRIPCDLQMTCLCFAYPLLR